MQILLSATIACGLLALASPSLACSVPPPFVGTPRMDGETIEHYKIRMAQDEARERAEAKNVLRARSTSVFRARISRVQFRRSAVTPQLTTFAPVSLLEGTQPPKRIKSEPLGCYPENWKVGDMVVIYAAFDASLKDWKVIEIEPDL